MQRCDASTRRDAIDLLAALVDQVDDHGGLIGECSNVQGREATRCLNVKIAAVRGGTLMRVVRVCVYIPSAIQQCAKRLSLTA
jgi:hypothetical protein